MDAERCVRCGRWTISHTITRPDAPPLCIGCEGQERRANPSDD